MDRPFSISVSRDRLKAVLNKTVELGEASLFVLDDMLKLLKEEKIIYGIKIEMLEELCNNPEIIEFPITVAEGQPQLDGKDAFLVNELKSDRSETAKEVFNFRNVLKIPSVKAGQILASINPPEPGKPGVDVFSNVIPAKDGKPLKIKAGKNVLMENGSFFAAIDGQISITNKTISVNPVFEVNGDIDLHTGNINFIGNVLIKGNVPSGYEIKAGGDVRVMGLVEGAIIEASGNVIISGGIAGANKGTITASGNVMAAFMNQAQVRSTQNIYVEKSILHSHISAGESIFCNRGTVIGGTLEAGRDIHIRELGNPSFTKTITCAGHDALSHDLEQQIHGKLTSLNQMLKKLTEIEQKLIVKAKAKGSFSEDEKQLIMKQRATKSQLEKETTELEQRLGELEVEKIEKLSSAIFVYEAAYPNVYLQFGKYSKSLNTLHHHIKFYFSHGDIHFESIN